MMPLKCHVFWDYHPAQIAAIFSVHNTHIYIYIVGTEKGKRNEFQKEEADNADGNKLLRNGQIAPAQRSK